MRNLILSAFPRNMRLPDPFTPNLKVDMLPEITVSPKIPTNVASLIQPPELKKNLDSYLKNRTPVTFLSDMRTFLQVGALVVLYFSVFGDVLYHYDLFILLYY